MGSRALVKGVVHTLVRKNPVTGRRETTSYVGSLRNKPSGWKVDKSVRPTSAMDVQSGTC